MLEDPSYDQVVRWGNEGDSFVVLDASSQMMSLKRRHSLTAATEREIHHVNLTETLQTQQFRQFRSTAKQIRFP
jgi:hypothetical protein